LTREFDIDVRWVAFPLHPEIPPDGLTLEKLFEDWMRSHRLGITAVPSFRLNQEMLVGAQPYEQLAAFATAHGVPRRAAA
jgi:predicted DsbA family dithiol-disulfide isomerase